MAGLTTAGFEIKRTADIVDDLRARVTAAFGPDTLTGADSVLGQLIAAFAIELGQVWELAGQTYDALDPDASEGVMLDNHGALVGVRREGATFSTGTVTLTGDASTVVPAGTVFEVAATGARFELIADATIGAGGTVDATVNGVTTGPLEALAGSLTTIVTPVDGLDSVTNATDITPGRDVESDAEYRVRRGEALQATGAAVDLAIRGALLDDFDHLTDVIVRSNRTLTDPDADGIPAKAFEAILYPDAGDAALDLQLAEAIFRLQPVGIEAHGDKVFTVTDDEGYSQTVKFSYATEVDYYVAATVTAGATYPADGDAQVAAALLAEGNLVGVGDGVRFWKFIAALDSIPGIEDVTIKIDTVDPPVNTANIAGVYDTIPRFDSSRITVSS